MKVSLLCLLFLVWNSQAQPGQVQVILPQAARQAKDLSPGIQDPLLQSEAEDSDNLEDVEDKRVEKSLLNTFPFNQDHDQHHHGEHHEHHEHHDEHHHDEHHESHHHDEDGAHSDVGSPLRTPLSNRAPLVPRFPFDSVALQAKNSNAGESSGDDLSRINSIVSDGTPDKSGRKCLDKIIMTEVTEWDEVVTCDHSYDKRCHTSYVTTYESQQEEECEENYRKVCMIEYENKAYNETVEICSTEIEKDCNKPGPDVCRTIYQSVCATINHEHQVEDDVTNCQTETMVKCHDVTEGYVTKQECDEWPVQRCSIEKKQVKKYTPETKCHKEPTEICGPVGCGFKDPPSVVCRNEVKTVVVEHPVESCDVEPVKQCRHVTKLVPQLVPRQECSEVPKEICSRSKTNPKKVKKPVIKKWCYTPTEESGLL